uniref:Uncharacterized protein n=1 Tax=Zea mays TaxID=4577 RepID=A0A804LUT0_MAIZE
ATYRGLADRSGEQHYHAADNLSAAVDERGERGHVHGGLGRGEVVEEVAVALAGRHVQARPPAPPAAPERVHVRALERPEPVLLRHRHQHPRRRQPPQHLRRQRHRVHVRVVHPVPSRADEVPRARRAPAHVPPQEVGVQQRQPPDPLLLPRRAHRQVLRDVAAGAVAGEEQAGRVAVPGQPGVPGPGPAAPRVRVRVRDHPRQRRPRVLVRRRERVLRRQAVVHRHRDDPGLGRQRVQVAVVHGVERRLDHERAAVEVHQHGEPAAGAAGDGLAARPVQPHREARPVVHDHVPGSHPGARVHGRRDERRAHEPVHAAALVLDQERREVELHLRVGVRGRLAAECRSFRRRSPRRLPRRSEQREERAERGDEQDRGSHGSDE